MDGKRILMLIGENSEEIGILGFKLAMETVGHEVDLICPGTRAGDPVATVIDDYDSGAQDRAGGQGRLVRVTQGFDGCDTDEYDALYIPGGRGPEYIRTYPRVREIVREFDLDGRAIFTLCRGLQVLVATPDVIQGRKVTGLFTVEPEARLAGANFVRIGVRTALRDGNLVTAERWTALPAFLRECLAALDTDIVHRPKAAPADLAAE